MVNQFLLHIALTVSHFLEHLNVESKFDFRLGVPPLERAHSGMRRNLWSFYCGGEHWVAFCGFHLKRDATLRTTFQTFDIRINPVHLPLPFKLQLTLLNLQYGFQ
jgi:hypothetical protein